MKSLIRLVFTGIIVLHSCVIFSQQLVLRGDYPDPSIIKVGNEYWASATTSNWAPVYPLLKSTDLKNWKTVGHIFTDLPEWADYYFWAPELNYDRGKYYVYYSAHKKGGNLCVAIASADKPEGPYKDHGPIICQEVGSIDAFPMRDENGKLHLIWKEDANSVGKPTPIWISEMDEARTKLIGGKKELFRNEQPWEANLVEGVSMIRRGGYYYAFYAAAGCCGAACTYGVGVARSKKLMGPWEKYAKNPVLTHNEQWKCPGHGTPVEKGGRHYFMYHGYDAKSNIFTGRQGLLIEYRFTSDGWIEFLQKSEEPSEPLTNEKDEFDSASLSADWQWSVFRRPVYELKAGKLLLSPNDSSHEAMLGHKILSANYLAETVIHLKEQDDSVALAVIGDDNNVIMGILHGKSLSVIQRKEGRDSVIVPARNINVRDSITLRVHSRGGKRLQFSYQTDGSMRPAALHSNFIDASYLPPWDRAVRVGLVAQGRGEFERFGVRYLK